ncbi:MAG TPA: SpoIIE family protein phosphatase, partial [Candidatus Eremiobacteraceae bacterium]|nr:SpoIIE family protein phosphatase [Candidatus Eremiobacteraceae bacterium]
LLQEDDSFQITALKHFDAGHAEIIAALRGTRVARPGATMGTAAVIRTGKTEIYHHLTAEDVKSMVGADILPSLQQLGYDSMAVIPLRARGKILGSLTASWIGGKLGRRLDLSDIPVLEELAARAASAIEHAQLFERQHHVANTLQRAFLPATFPVVPGIRFDAVYASGQSEAEIGGDWYDAFELPDGRIFLSVGDVAGRGLPAAVTMGKMRQALRSCALEHTDLAEVLVSANNSLRLEDPDTMVTVFVGAIDRDAQTLSYALAGHPRPFMHMPDGSIIELSGEGIPLGVRSHLTVNRQTVPFPLEAMLVCYTDGLTETTHDVLEGEARLRRALADDAILHADHPAEALMRAVVASDHHDDVAVLTVSTQHAFPGSLNLALPAHASSAQKVRQAIRAFTRDLKVTPERDFEIQVAVGEAVNNVIEHAYGAAKGNVWIDAQSKNGKLIVEVSDRGSWRMPRQDHGGRGLRIIESLCENVVVHSGKDRSYVRLTFDVG